MKWVSERRFLHFIEDIKKLFAYKNEIPTKLSELEDDIGLGGATDTSNYDLLQNAPIKNIVSNQENMIAIRDLASGVYCFSGSFTPFAGSNIYYNFSDKQLVNVVTKAAGTHMQIFYPVNNCVQFVSIMVDEESDSGFSVSKDFVYLNDLKEKIDGLESIEGVEY